MLRKVLTYINPIAQLGNPNYSFIFPLSLNIVVATLLEIYVHSIVNDPTIVAVYAIVFFIAIIIYTSFRDGIQGGFISTTFTLGYYLYIVYTREYTPEQFESAIETIVFLGVIYFMLALIIGWLKQTVDRLIEREANEKNRLRTIVEQLPVGVIVTDSAGQVVMANKRLDSILGTRFPLGFQIGSKSLFDIKNNYKKVTPSKGPLAQILTGKTSLEDEYTITRKDGKNLYLHIKASAIFNREHKLMAAAAIINDITQRKEIELRKDDFVNMASHELKTPITSMKLYISSLEKQLKELKDEKAITTLQHIHDQTNRLQKLVYDLLDVSRLQTGKLTFSKEKFRLDELIQETIDVMKSSHSTFTISFKEKQPITVDADRFRIYQVLTNLLNNAIKYSSKSNEIHIMLHKSNHYAKVSVIDFGIGITKDQQEKIFERLYQVPDNKTNTFPGFGMGLYISKEIIKRHKGRIGVKSAPNQGSTFSFTLPI